MDSYVPLTIAEEFQFWELATQTTTAMLAVEGSFVFAYLAALYYFVGRSSLSLRLFAHAAISVLIGYFWFMHYAHQWEIQAFLEHRQLAIDAGTIVLAPGYAAAETYTVVEFGNWVIGVVHVGLFAGLTYLAFWHDWSKPEGRA
jgi:hypothetical protein